jgi:hypothetical protein
LREEHDDALGFVVRLTGGELHRRLLPPLSLSL